MEGGIWSAETQSSLRGVLNSASDF